MEQITPVPRISATRLEIAAQVLCAVALLLLLKLGLLTALLAGLMIYHLIDLVAPALVHAGVKQRLGKTIALAILVVVVATLLALAVVKLMNLLTGGLESVVALLQRMAEVVDTALTRLPAWAQAYLPEDTAELQTVVANWLRGHANELGSVGQGVGRFLFDLVMGLVIGGLVAMQSAAGYGQPGPLAQALQRRIDVLSTAFRNIVFSQFRISALNTTLTAIYLVAVLPAFGVHLPLVKTMIAVTFVAGLLPVLGNLISNAVIVVVSFSVSPTVAAAGLVYLVLIHKLEYFANARIIGSRIQARAWELLIALVSLEAAFGIPGLVAAPIYYAYFKDELKLRGLI